MRKRPNTATVPLLQVPRLGRWDTIYAERDSHGDTRAARHSNLVFFNKLQGDSERDTRGTVPSETCLIPARSLGQCGIRRKGTAQ